MTRAAAGTFIITALVGYAGLSQAQDLNSLKNEFRQGPDEALLQGLVAYRDTIPDNSSFEVDYMIAVTLGDLPAFQDTACDYFKSVQFYHHAPYYFDNRPVNLAPYFQRYCPPPPPQQPGVRTAFALRIPVNGAALNEVKRRLATTKKPVGRGFHPAIAAAVVRTAPTDGVYSMVHDGWKGELVLQGTGGTYAGSDGQKLPVKVISLSGYHLIFVVVGLGGENADGLGGQKFDGYQMTQTRDAIAGVTWWQGQPFGFYAVKR